MEDSPESEHLPLGWAEEYPDPEDPPVYSWISRPWSLDYSVHQAGSRKRSADSLDFSEQQNNCPSSSADQNSTGFRSLRFSSKLDVATGMKKRRMSNTAHSLTDPEFSKSEGMSPYVRKRHKSCSAANHSTTTQGHRTYGNGAKARAKARKF